MVSAKKQNLVQNLKKDLQNSLVIGLVNMQNLPAEQLQKMRAMLRDKHIKVFMARKRLLRLALQESNKNNVQSLMEKIKGMPALLLSNENPFTLYSIIQKNKSEAYAKAGQEAPRDIVVKAGATSFAPGPIISELAAVGIKTKVENGKLAIISDVTIVKEGGVISPKVAETLKRLDIKPMEIGLNLVAALEEGILFNAKELHIDPIEYTQRIMQAAQWAMNLAVEGSYFTTETVDLLLQKAYREAKAVSEEQKNVKIDENMINNNDYENNDETEEESSASVEEATEMAENKTEESTEVEEEAAEEIENYVETAKVEVTKPVEKVQDFNNEPKLSKPHPKQGNVSLQEAENLFNELQKKGSLRK